MATTGHDVMITHPKELATNKHKEFINSYVVIILSKAQRIASEFLKLIMRIKIASEFFLFTIRCRCLKVIQVIP